MKWIWELKIKRCVFKSISLGWGVVWYFSSARGWQMLFWHRREVKWDKLALNDPLWIHFHAKIGHHWNSAWKCWYRTIQGKIMTCGVNYSLGTSSTLRVNWVYKQKMKLVISISLFSLSYKIWTWAKGNHRFSLLTVQSFLILQSHFFLSVLWIWHVRGARHPMYYGLVLDRPLG